jgi:hypothetical protein
MCGPHLPGPCHLLLPPAEIMPETARQDFCPPLQFLPDSTPARAYKTPTPPSPFLLCKFHQSATRLHAKGRRISRIPTATGDNSGEIPPPLDLYPVPFLLFCPRAHHWHVFIFNCLRFRSKHPRPTQLPAGTTPMSYSSHRGLPRALPPRHRLRLVNLNAANILTDIQDHRIYLAIDARAPQPRCRWPRGELLPSLDPSCWIQIQWILFC